MSRGGPGTVRSALGLDRNPSTRPCRRRKTPRPPGDRRGAKHGQVGQTCPRRMEPTRGEVIRRWASAPGVGSGELMADGDCLAHLRARCRQCLKILPPMPLFHWRPTVAGRAPDCATTRDDAQEFLCNTIRYSLPSSAASLWQCCARHLQSGATANGPVSTIASPNWSASSANAHQRATTLRATRASSGNTVCAVKHARQHAVYHDAHRSANERENSEGK